MGLHTQSLCEPSSDNHIRTSRIQALNSTDEACQRGLWRPCHGHVGTLVGETNLLKGRRVGEHDEIVIYMEAGASNLGDVNHLSL